jgi:hypothetical protein
MIDVVRKERISVLKEEGSPPYMIVPEEQLDAIVRILDTNNVAYEVDEESLSLDGKPFVTFIIFDRKTDRNFVQRLLDDVP